MTYLLAALASRDAPVAARDVEFDGDASARLGFGHIVAELDDEPLDSPSLVERISDALTDR